jgi:hypothetical protein
MQNFYLTPPENPKGSHSVSILMGSIRPIYDPDLLAWITPSLNVSDPYQELTVFAAANATPPPRRTLVTPDELKILMMPEFADIKAARSTNPMVDALYDIAFESDRPDIDLRAPFLVDSLRDLVKSGLLSQGKLESILAGV